MDENQQELGNMPSNTIRNVGGKAGRLLKQILKKILKKVLIIGLVVVFFMSMLLSVYYILFETRGSEQNYTINPSGANETVKGYLGGNPLSTQNQTMLNFYTYHSNNSYYQIIGNDNTKLQKSEGENKVEDYFKREGQFMLNPNFLFSLDEFLFRGITKYPEQFCKPVNYDPATLTLKPLSNEDGVLIAQSTEWRDGIKTENKVEGVWDYGLTSIYKYQTFETRETLEGAYVKQDVWDDALKRVVAQPIAPEPFEIELKKEDVWLINKAIVFNGEYEWAFKTDKNELRQLLDGESEDVTSDYIKIKYGTYDQYEDVPYLDCTSGECIPSTRSVLVATHDLYKYRQGAVYEYVPRIIGEDFVDKGDTYYNDYVLNFQSYIPHSVLTSFDFHNRVGTLLYTNLEVGKWATPQNENYARSMMYFDIAKKYGDMFGVDPHMIIAQMALESGGNPNINADGLMQIISINGVWDRTITANTVDGRQVTLTITKEQRSNPDISIQWATMYVSNLLKMYDGDILKAIQAYNMGPGSLDWIKQNYPYDWDSAMWMNHRKEAQMAVLKSETSGAPEYIEYVLRYYKGSDDYSEFEEHDQESGLEKFVSFLTGLFPKYKDDEPHYKISSPVNAYTPENILKMTIAMDNQLVFSDSSLVDKLDFWDEGFMAAFRNQNMSFMDVSEVIPGIDEYRSPLDIAEPIISKPYGSQKNPQTNEMEFFGGVEVAVPIGTPIYSVSDGLVIVSVSDANGENTNYGKYLKIKHDDGTEAIYAHLETVLFKKGQRVTKGQQIGTTGNSGKSSGSNLYMEFYVGGERIDPYYIMVRSDEYISNSTPLLNYALSLLGKPYVWAAEGPEDWDKDGETSIGYDCSGFVGAVFYYNGKNIGRDTAEGLFKRVGTSVSFNNLQPEDIVFFDMGAGDPGHVGIYIGGNKFIHASSTKKKIVITKLVGSYRDKFRGAKRV